MSGGQQAFQVTGRWLCPPPSSLLEEVLIVLPFGEQDSIKSNDCCGNVFKKDVSDQPSAPQSTEPEKEEIQGRVLPTAHTLPSF